MNYKLLIKRLKNGQESAYAFLFKEYYEILTLFANKYIEDIETSKEIVQDLFVQLYERRDKIDIEISLKSYLFRSIHNRCLNHINSLKIKKKYADLHKSKAEWSINDIEEEIGYTELQSFLSKAIKELPPKCRMIFTMNRYQGLSNAEIADKLDLSKRTVETQISKALKILRGKMEPYLAEH